MDKSKRNVDKIKKHQNILIPTEALNAISQKNGIEGKDTELILSYPQVIHHLSTFYYESKRAI